ncbi:MAG: hypothetical protein HKK67_04745 [Chlorobiaceae bacterium]|nr:hypothetical protein [Chlorobiaceae bacterium]
MHLGIYLCGWCHLESMSEAQASEKVTVWKDANGKILNSVTVINGSIKEKNIRLIDEYHDIDCKIELLNSFVSSVSGLFYV